MGTLGGVFLIIGAFFTYHGDIYKSALVYFLADIVWMYLAYQINDIQGLGFIIVGTLLGVGAFVKMHTGRMRKDLKHEETR